MIQPDDLKAALARHLGESLTPERATAIFLAAIEGQDRSLDLSRFDPQTQPNGLVFAVERFSDVLDELHPLHVTHWHETEKHRLGLPLAPNYDEMKRRERQGGLVQFTVRKAGRLVGQCRMYLGKSLHTQTLYADEDTLFLADEVRGGFLAVHLLRYVEGVMLALGAREIRANSKLVNGADVLMRRLGYEPVALQFVKVFAEEAPCART